jgi:hypothetical protein
MQDADDFLKRIFSASKLNLEFDDVLTKVTLLNEFYSTNIKGSKEHILFSKEICSNCESKKLDDKIQKGDISAINAIVEISENSVNKRLLSFVTKYCHIHNPEKFPVYDSYVVGMLKLFWLKNNSFSTNVSDLTDVNSFKSAMDEFIQFSSPKYGCSMSYKQADIFLWSFGKFIVNYGNIKSFQSKTDKNMLYGSNITNDIETALNYLPKNLSYSNEIALELNALLELCKENVRK